MRKAFTIAAAVVVVGILWLTRSPATPANSSQAVVVPAALGPQRCTFAPDATLAYRWTSKVEARDPLGRAQVEPDHFAAVLSLRVTAVAAEATTLEAALTDVDLRQQIAKDEGRVRHALSDTFSFDVADDCRVAAFRFPEAWSGAARRLVAGMVLNGEMVLRPDPRWEVEQRDGIGPYHARYTRGGTTVRRQKVFYDPQGFDALGLKLRLIDAQSEATMGLEGPVRLRGHEHFQMVAGRQVQVDLEQTFSWDRDDTLYRRPAAGPALSAADPFATSARERRLPPAPADLRVAEARFHELAANLSHLTTSQAQTFAALVAGHPALLVQLTQRLDGDALTDAGRADVFWILELAGARDAIIPWLEGPAKNDRIRAALALAGAGEPTLDTGRRLAQLHRDDPDPQVATTGLLALGSLSPEGDTEVQTFVRTSLRSTHDTARTSHDRLAVIQAMGNSHDPSFVAPLRSELAHVDPKVRDRAARALGKIGEDGASGEARPALKDALAREPDPRAARGIIASLQKLGPPQREEIPWVAQQLRDATASAVRAGLIAWLGASPTPEASAALAAHFHVETSSDLRQLIGRYVTADELKEA